MAYEVLYRKYRPRDFAGLVGQEHVRKALEHALEHDRLHHAYLFTGTRGVGKTTIARILARCLNCERGVGLTPCGECSSCRAIDGGRFLDLIEVDAASRTKVEDTRELLENVQYPPVQGRYKVYLIDEVHMLSNSSFNALLKTLEEPPPRVVFLLATTEPKRLPVTVLSRCLQFSLKGYRPEQIAGHLRAVMTSESIRADDGALRLIARAARGSMRDALSLADQAIAHGGGALEASAVEALLGTIDLNELSRLGRGVAAGDASALLAVSAAIADAGADFEAALQRLTGLWHAVAVQQAGVDVADDSDDAALARELALAIDPELTQLLYQIAVIGGRDLQLAPEPRIGFEMALLRMLAFTPKSTSVAGTSSHVERARLPHSEQVGTAAQTLDEVAGEGATTVPQTEQRVERAIDASSDGRLDWLALAPALRLTGIARDIAMNLVPVQRVHAIREAHGGGLWQFELDAPRLALLTEAHLSAIAEAIAQQIGELPRLQVVANTRGGETPASKQLRDEAQRRAHLLEVVRADPVVRALQERFGASIDESSLRPA